MILFRNSAGKILTHNGKVLIKKEAAITPLFYCYEDGALPCNDGTEIYVDTTWSLKQLPEKTISLYFSSDDVLNLLYTGPVGMPIDPSSYNDHVSMQLGLLEWTFVLDTSSWDGFPDFTGYPQNVEFEFFRIDPYEVFANYPYDGQSQEMHDYLKSLRGTDLYLGKFYFNYNGTGKWAKVA